MKTVMEQIEIERRRQDEKWGVQDHGADRWVTILTKSMGEVAQASISGWPYEMRKTLVELAAVAAAAVESFDRNAKR